MTKKLWIPALIAAATVSANAFAHGGDRGDWGEHRRHHRHHHHDRWAGYLPPPRMPVHVRQPVIYSAPPVIYRERVVYPSAPAYYGPPSAYPAYPGRHSGRRGDRVAAQAIGAIAGGVIGNQVGDGHLAPTLIGAVIGGAVGDHLAGH